MRAIKRLPLDPADAAFLAKRRKGADVKRAGGRIDSTKMWKAARQAGGMAKIHGVLKRMVGARERCMYCLDSHGSDIEHFWPKTPYPEKMFLWENLLLCCAPCGRFKADTFPLAEGRPLLLDPAGEDPWSFLDFDPDTGNLTSRFLSDLNAPSEKGRVTVEVLHLDRREAVAAGYRKTWMNIRSVAERCLGGTLPESQLAGELLHTDDHGLLGWCTRGSGHRVPPFDRLWRKAPAVKQQLAKSA